MQATVHQATNKFICNLQPIPSVVITVMLMQEEELLSLVQKYLASIPKTNDEKAKQIKDLNPLPVQFPEQVIREDVK